MRSEFTSCPRYVGHKLFTALVFYHAASLLPNPPCVKYLGCEVRIGPTGIFDVFRRRSIIEEFSQPFSTLYSPYSTWGGTARNPDIAQRIPLFNYPHQPKKLP